MLSLLDDPIARRFRRALSPIADVYSLEA